MSGLSGFIDFFWETDFEKLWEKNPTGFTDVLFPNIGYTYIINLGTPFTISLQNGNTHEIRSGGFLPRQSTIKTHHQTGNHLFGIKLRVSPLIFESKINFSEYKGQVFPLTYLLNKQILQQVQNAGSFEERTEVMSDYFLSGLMQYEERSSYVLKILEVIEEVFQTNNFSKPVELIAKELNVSTRTLQRYFEVTTGFGCKQALQVMRIRKAVAEITNSPETFDYKLFGYYDYSHFYKHLRQFIGTDFAEGRVPHLELLEKLRLRMN